MTETQNRNTITSKILKTADIKWKDVKFLQQDDFKELPASDKQKLKNSIVANEFLQPFYVWQDVDEVIYCLDGKHRTLILQELISEGLQVPETLPAIFIDCLNIDWIRKYKDPACELVYTKGKHKYLFPLTSSLKSVCKALTQPYPKPHAAIAQLAECQPSQAGDGVRLDLAAQKL